MAQVCLCKIEVVRQSSTNCGRTETIDRFLASEPINGAQISPKAIYLIGGQVCLDIPID